MRNVTLEELLEAGCHFGHQVSRQNPKAGDYIFEARDNIHIIDLEKTKEGLEEAGRFVKSLAKNGGTFLILGTKRQAQEVLNEELAKLTDSEKNGLYWVTKRWIGGTFTNLSEVSKNFQKLKDLKKDLKDELFKERFTKREIGEMDKDRQKLEGFYGGLAAMTKVPDAIFVIDTHLEDQAVKEAKAMRVRVIGITDTNADPLIIDNPIPANDDAVGSIRLIASYVLDAWKEGLKSQGGEKKEAEKVKESVGEKEEKKEKVKTEDKTKSGGKEIKKKAAPKKTKEKS
jgi:small subunit ribosomal protein S2